MRILLDTCALLWWTVDPDRLPKTALRDFNEAETLWMSSISIWEIGLKIKNKKLDIGLPIEEYSQRLKELSTLNIVPVTDKLWLKNLSLPWAHRDPADRTIVATAEAFNCYVATSDQVILDYSLKIMDLRG